MSTTINASSPLNWFQNLRQLQSNIGEQQTSTPTNIKVGGLVSANDIKILLTDLNKLKPTSNEEATGTNKVYYSYVENYTLPEITTGASIEALQSSSIESAISKFLSIFISNSINSRQYCSDTCLHFNADCSTFSRDYVYTRVSPADAVYAVNGEFNFDGSYGTGNSKTILYCPEYTGYYVKSSSQKIGNCIANTCQKKL